MAALLGIDDDQPQTGLLGEIDKMNQLALGPLYVPRDPGTLTGAGAAGTGPSGSEPAPARGLSLEQVHPRTLRPLTNEPDMTQPGNHAFSIKDPTGEPMGIVDTEWSPQTGGLHIADVQSNAGPNSWGPAVVRQLRELLLAQYPGVRSLSGQRITGAVSADRPSGSGPGRAATQTVREP